LGTAGALAQPGGPGAGAHGIDRAAEQVEVNLVDEDGIGATKSVGGWGIIAPVAGQREAGAGRPGGDERASGQEGEARGAGARAGAKTREHKTAGAEGRIEAAAAGIAGQEELGRSGRLVVAGDQQ